MNQWQQLFAEPGGTVAAFATVQLPSGEACVCAATPAGVFTSTSAGGAWRRYAWTDDAPFSEAIAVSRENILYAGGRGGLYRSEPHSHRWERILVGARVLSLVCSGDLLLVGTEQYGVLRSEDRGRTFAGANAGLLDLTVIALEVSPEFEQDGTAFLASGSGLYRTRNGGKSWRPLEVDAAVQCLYVSPTFTHDGVVLAGTESEGLLRSDDAGAQWATVADFPGTSVTAIVRSRHSGVFAAATDVGIALSENGIATWRLTADDLGAVLALTFAAEATEEVLLAGQHRGGVARAAAPFDCWTASNDGLQARLLLSPNLSPAFDSDQTMFAAGLDDGVLVSRDAGRTWTAHLCEAEAPPVSSIAVSPDFATDRTLFAATEAGLFRSRDGGASWSPALDGRTAAVVLATERRVVVALAHGELLESADGGETWRSPTPHFDAELVSLAHAPDGTLFVGTRANGELTLWRCNNDGAGRERWLVQRGGDLLPVAVSPTFRVDQTVYVGVGTRVLSPTRGTRETRAGEQHPMWRAVDVGATVTALAAASDAQQRPLLFAATSAGIFVSRDAGATFSRSPEEGGPQACVGIAVSMGGQVYALELGGAVWRRGKSVTRFP